MGIQPFNPLSAGSPDTAEPLAAEIVDSAPLRLEGCATVAEATEALWLAMRASVWRSVLRLWFVVAGLALLLWLLLADVSEIAWARAEGSLVAVAIFMLLFSLALFRSARNQAVNCEKHGVYPCEHQIWLITPAGVDVQTPHTRSFVAWEAHRKYLVSPRVLVLLEAGNLRARILCKSFCEQENDWQRLLALVAEKVPH